MMTVVNAEQSAAPRNPIPKPMPPPPEPPEPLVAAVAPVLRQQYPEPWDSPRRGHSPLGLGTWQVDADNVDEVMETDSDIEEAFLGREAVGHPSEVPTETEVSLAIAAATTAAATPFASDSDGSSSDLHNTPLPERGARVAPTSTSQSDLAIPTRATSDTDCTS